MSKDAGNDAEFIASDAVFQADDDIVSQVDSLTELSTTDFDLEAIAVELRVRLRH